MQAHGVPLVTIAEWLGQSSPDITARLCLHADIEALREAASVLGKIGGSSSAAPVKTPSRGCCDSCVTFGGVTPACQGDP